MSASAHNSEDGVGIRRRDAAEMETVTMEGTEAASSDIAENGDRNGYPAAAAVHARVRQLAEAPRPRIAGLRSRSVSGSRSPDPSSSPEPSPRSCRPAAVSRVSSLRYSGGALHGVDQPTSFDHNFESLPAAAATGGCKAASSSPPAPRRPVRRLPRSRDEAAEAAEAVTHLSRQLPPLVRVQAEVAEENGAGARYTILYTQLAQ